MKIRGNTISFKSTPENFFKERDGHKCNTVRRFTEWSELKAFEQFRNEFSLNAPNKMINISCFGGEFARAITDICSFEEYWIISWKHEK